MDYNNFVLAFSGFQHGNFWYKNYNFISFEEGIISRFKPVDLVISGVNPENKSEKIKKELDLMKVKPKKLLYLENDNYGYWNFEEDKFVRFINQVATKEIITSFLIELYTL